ncbi:MAG TPA: KEOPS complex subunit Pcc1 [Candidatus Nanoarchaeia archaeon]|nr:KEOPS complex subunit Pcc1 [Candidatus Nanoarchaeia archaeon]
MKYQCTIVVPDPKGHLGHALATEARKQDRSTTEISRSAKKVQISIAAKDAIAFKAAVHTMIQLLAVDEQMEDIVHGR